MKKWNPAGHILFLLYCGLMALTPHAIVTAWQCRVGDNAHPF